MEKIVSAPAVLAVCLDLQSLTYNAVPSGDERHSEHIPRSLAQRLKWNQDTAGDRSRPRGESGSLSRNLPRRFLNTRFDMMEAHSADDALGLLRMLRFELALIGADVLGESVPSFLRQAQLISPQTRRVVVTSSMDKRCEQSIREAGVLAILDAPLPLDQLRDVLDCVAVGR